MDELRLELLGAPRITRDGHAVRGFISSKAQALLCYLAITGRPHTRATLAGLLWGELPEDDARRNLRSALANLRQLAGSHLAITRETLAFERAAPYWLDVEHFETGLAMADRAPPDLGRLQAAVALYQGDLLEGLYVRDAPAFEEWLTGQRERLRQRALGALQALVAHASERAAYAQGIDAATRLLAVEPWEENTHRQLMRLLAVSGRRDAALAQYAACRRILQEELGVEPAVETTVLAEQIRAGAIIARPAIGRARHNLPVQRLPLIGRDQAVADVLALLDRSAVGLLTLVGPGGVGKTRLALEVAGRACAAFADGVWFVDLAPITDAGLVAATIAQALGMQETVEQTPATRLRATLQEKQLLLVLDNFEQVLAAAPLVADLLAAAPGLKVLVTSRTRLPLSTGQAYPLPPLTVPGQGWGHGEQQGSDRDVAAADLCDLARVPAVQVFVQRAQALQPDFRLSPTNAAAVAAICTRLEGLPLALELAAGRITLFAPQALLARLDHRLDLLHGAAADRPARQRTLRATLAWSYDLLAPGEQALFRRLAVFRGGWTLAAAAAVSTPGLGDVDVVDGLMSLVHQHLLRVLPTASDPAAQTDGEPRFGMLETMREYGLEQLDAAGETTLARQRHLAWCLALAERAVRALRGSALVAGLLQLEAEHDNLRAALRWAQESGHAEALLQLSGTLATFWLYRGHQREGRAWLATALAAARAGGAGMTRAHAEALLGAGVLAVWHGEHGHGRAMLEASLGHFEERDDRQGIARARYELGNVAWIEGDYAEAVPRLTQSLALARTLGDALLIIRCVGSLAQAAALQGDTARATALLAEGLPLARDLGDSQRIAMLLMTLAFCRLQEDALGEVEAAASEALARFQAIGERWLMLYPFLGLAAVATGQGRARRAARLLGQGDALAERLSMPIMPALGPWHSTVVAAAQAQLREDVFHQAWAEGRAMSLEQAIAYALAESEEAGDDQDCAATR